ncbi:hypothetical protein NC653_014610 [Populus alba x Populus x berolinensis]|uniref:Uncharacterized protein n=1 Tax=Populus alba x Populus x berolinensis TaxID=444605 RepID=A0AAD6QXI1_9ROSI|nr:hypothetical protein NC653_014610 [Populus alba x Populus x berolinensis]
MPCVAPITEGFPKKTMSRRSQVNKLVAVHTWVLRMARDASVLATKGPPPLKPLHPHPKQPSTCQHQ